MVGHTRGSPEGFGRETGSGSQQPPPPPSNLAKLMAMQTELLRQLVKGKQNQPCQHHGGWDAQPAGYQEFFGTQPPLFSCNTLIQNSVFNNKFNWLYLNF